MRPAHTLIIRLTNTTEKMATGDEIGIDARGRTAIVNLPTPHNADHVEIAAEAITRIG